MKSPRHFTFKLLEDIENGLDKDQVIMAFCFYCSESDVAEMMRSNELLIEEDEEVDDSQ